MSAVIRCAGCGRELREGEPVIRDTLSAFVGAEGDDVIDDLAASIFGTSDGTMYLCDGCTETSTHGWDREIFHARVAEGTE